MATQAVKVKNDESQGGMGSEITGKVTGSLANMKEFLHDTRVEMKQVTWPTREQVRNLTVLVFVVSAAVGVYIAFFDQMWTAVLRFITTGQFLPS